MRFETVIPNAVKDGRLELRLVPQARLEPIPLDVKLDAPGWTITGANRVQRPWAATITIGWTVRR